jgi:outer membrane protein OmpA-like peptidoglycan-associated protein
MNPSAPLLPWLPWLLLVSSCGGPPKPPTVDESRKRPANTSMAVELQTCRHELQNTRLLAAESARSTEASSLAAARLAQQQQALLQSTSPTAQRNLLVPVLFAFGSTRMTLPDAEATRIVEAARGAPLILLRGRTDGSVESSVESAVARQRAAAVERWLVQAGVEPARIRTTWQPVGDHAADNSTLGGRALNRRVEIEVYRAAPIVATVEGLGAPTVQRTAAQ